MPKGDTCWSLEEYINFALWEDGSSFIIGNAEEENITIVQPHLTPFVTSQNPEPSQPLPPCTDIKPEPTADARASASGEKD